MLFMEISPMTEIFNVYCDECCCHLEHALQKIIVLGAILCPLEKAAIQRQIDQLV